MYFVILGQIREKGNRLRIKTLLHIVLEFNSIALVAIEEK